jgi:LPXTG-site transpeptidase (sortase) family protein
MKINLNSAFYFITITLGVFVITFLLLYSLDLVPRFFQTKEVPNSVLEVYELPQNEEKLPETFTKPERIVIKSIGVDARIFQPYSVNVAVLDETLKKGAVYYPGSGTVEQGNIFVFGHSTNWPIVQNQAYKTFNGLEKLQIGEEIILEANNEIFKYKVKSVQLADANNSLVEFDNSGRKLTISTCNTFGQKQERWVVVAEGI